MKHVTLRAPGGHRRAGQLLLWTLMVVAGAALLTSCQTARVITVSTFLDGSDANTADGVCEMTSGLGDCSLRAAVDEANATSGPVSISVPSGTYTLASGASDDDNAAGDLDIVKAGPGAVTFAGADPGVRVDAAGNDAAVDVRSSRVDMRGFAFTGAAGPGIDVHTGTLWFDRGASFANAGAGARVAPGATLDIVSVTLSGNGASGADVAGQLNVGYSTISANTGGGIVGTGSAAAAGNVIADQASGPDCTANVVSKGYNLDGDGSCALTGSFDITDAAPDLAPLNATLIPFHRPNPGSAAIDAVDPGAFCGTGTRDATNAARPIGPSCDRGALEANYTSTPTANADAMSIGEDDAGTTLDVVGNDSDPDDGDRLVVTGLDTAATTGSVTNNGVDVTYDPSGAFDSLALGATATDTFGYTITDGSGNTTTATVTVTINGADDGPTATDDMAWVGEDGPATTVDVLANDTDPDTGDTLDVWSVDTTGTLGSVTNNGDHITYDPNGAFEAPATSGFATTSFAAVGGVDTFTYTVVDDAGATATATVTIYITPVNDAPTAVDDTGSVSEDGAPVIIDVLANDTDPDAFDTKTVQSVDTSGTLGGVTSFGTHVEYDPIYAFDTLKAGESATDTFTYTMVDSGGATSTATVTVTITGENDAPAALDDDATVGEDGPAVAIDVLGNDTDPDSGDTKTVTAIDASGVFGSVTTDGTNVTYDPNGAFEELGAGETVTDLFSYTMTDGNGSTSTALVLVTVTGANDGPTAIDDAASTGENFPAGTVDVLGNDTDPDASDTLHVVSVDTTGTLGLVAYDGTDVSYDPNGAFEAAGGFDVFRYTVADGTGATSTATVTMTVVAENDAPNAVDDTGSVNEDGPPAMIDVLANDTDPDSFDALTVTSVDTNVTAGSATTFGTFVGYNPGSAFDELRPGETAIDTFMYTVEDAAGLQSTATVVVTITGQNDAPMAASDLAAVDEDGPGVTIDVLANDSDPDASDTSAVDDINSSSTRGSVTNNGTDVTYDPNGQFESLTFGQTATDSFSYRVIDGAGGTSTAMVTVIIQGSNDAPVAMDQTATVRADDVVLINVLADVTDPDSGDTRQVQSVDGTGTLGEVTAFGSSVGYRPFGAFDHLLAGETATDSFTYTVIDSQGATSTATVVVTITGVNDGPTATQDAAATDANTGLMIDVLGNDTDPDDGDTMVVQSVGVPGDGGSATTDGTTVTFTPDASFQDLLVGESRDTSFTYTIVDGAGATSTALVTVTVFGVN